MFEYVPPRCGFSFAEQQLLSAALAGATDQELSCELAISISTVKKNWISIYKRAAASLPDVVPDDSPADGGTSERGKEKRRHLLAYLREHPEELRPIRANDRSKISLSEPRLIGHADPPLLIQK
jgi:hypothetical protein